MMKTIRHDKGTLYIGPFWMGTPEQIEETQAAIDEELALYECGKLQDDSSQSKDGEPN